MLAAGLDPLVAIWKERGVQMLVLLSLALQVILIVTAEIRRRRDSDVLRVVVWSAYLLADTTAIYTLGHMSVTTRPPEHELVAFWAPFLLLHLGGQDNIMAYSIEDNRLWLRHLQNFAVQVVAAAYVLYESSIFSGGGPNMLRQATILMFLVGVVKYGERVWALMSASSSTLSGKNYRSFGRLHFEHSYVSAISIPLYLAHDLLNIPKHLLKGPLPLVSFDTKESSSWEDMYNAAEIQLSLMHDVFYSKAELIYTCYGHCIRLTSLAATATALRLFLGLSDKDGYNRVDVAATYVLLAGAVVLEITSLLRVTLSSWIYQQIITLRRGPSFAVGMHTRYWSGSMGQHNFIDMCSHCKDNRGSKIARWMGREDWWNTLVYTSSSVPVSTYFSPLLKKQMRQSVDMEKENPDHIQNSRGQAVLKKRGLYDDELLARSVGLELDESILVWHIATHVYLNWYEGEHRSLPHLAKVTEELSNYMMFLLAARPYMLPENASRQRYVELCNKVINDLKLKYSSAKELIKFIRDNGDALGAGRPQPSRNVDTIEENVDTIIENETFDRASQLASKLISMATPDAGMIELISQVWVEMLCYVSYQCRPDSHARQLSNGGEITTIVALLVEYLKSDFLKFDE